MKKKLWIYLLIVTLLLNMFAITTLANTFGDVDNSDVSINDTFDYWGFLGKEMFFSVSGGTNVYTSFININDTIRKYDFGFKSNINGVSRFHLEFKDIWNVYTDVNNTVVFLNYFVNDKMFSFTYNWSDIIDAGFVAKEIYDEHNFTQYIYVNSLINQDVVIDPIFGYSGIGSGYASIENLQYGNKRLFIGGVGKSAYNVTCVLTNPLTIPMTKYKCALFWASNGTFFAQTEERNSYGFPLGSAAVHNFTFNPPVYLVNNTEYYIVAFGNNGHIQYIQQPFPPTWQFTKTNSATYPTWDNATWVGLVGRQTVIFVTYDDALEDDPCEGLDDIDCFILTGGILSFDENQFFLILMFSFWCYLLYIAQDKNAKYIYYMQFIVHIPLFLYVSSIAWLNTITMGYIFAGMITLISVYFLFVGLKIKVSNED